MRGPIEFNFLGNAPTVLIIDLEELKSNPNNRYILKIEDNEL